MTDEEVMKRIDEAHHIRLKQEAMRDFHSYISTYGLAECIDCPIKMTCDLNHSLQCMKRRYEEFLKREQEKRK